MPSLHVTTLNNWTRCTNLQISQFGIKIGLCAGFCWSIFKSDGYWHEGENRLWKQLEVMANKYNLHGNGNRSTLKNIGNLKFSPIISDNDKDKLVIEKIPPPPLHIKLGVVDHLVKRIDRNWAKPGSHVKTDIMVIF